MSDDPFHFDAPRRPTRMTPFAPPPRTSWAFRASCAALLVGVALLLLGRREPGMLTLGAAAIGLGAPVVVRAVKDAS